MMSGHKGIHMVTFLLLAVGGLNWLLVGVAGWDISAWLGGMDSTPARVIYILVGLSALYELITHKATCKHCGSKSEIKTQPMGGSVSPMP